MAVLKVGRVPRHIAIIMDGNRRFARQKGLEKMEGHKGGFEKLASTLEWCRDMGVTEVTVYAFSIENFKRSSQEVEDLLTMAREKLQLLVGEKEKLREHGVRVKILGKLSYLPQDLQDVITEAERVTADNCGATLNIALSYTGREEIAQAVRSVVGRVGRGEMETKDISEQSIELDLYTQHGSRPDLLIRTSGETRLSDFLLWQCSHTVLYFTEVLWPDFSLLHLLGAVLFYQRNVWKVEKIMADRSSDEMPKGLEQQAEVANILESMKIK